VGKGCWFVIALVAIFASVMVALARTAHSDLRPYLGKWTGGFYADPTNKRLDLTGYLQIYATHQTFKLHLEGEQQGIDVDGTWVLEKKQLIFKPTKVAIEDDGGELKRNPNLTYYPNADVKAAYSKPFVLNPSKDNKRLEGLLTSIGKREGIYRFDWGGSGR
jgi:hypothetical protein